MKDMKITFSDTSRDFSGWFREKNNSVLLALCSIIKECPEVINTNGFSVALKDTLKLFGLAHEDLDGLYNELIIELLIRYNTDGYYFLIDLLNNTKESKLMQFIHSKEIDEEIMKLIENNNKLNRTKIAVLLGNNNYKTKWEEQIEDDIEYVHQGIQTWDWFYQKHCNDRNNVEFCFDDPFIKEVFDSFYSNNDCQ